MDVMLGGERRRATFETHTEAARFELETITAHKLGKPLPPLPVKGVGRPGAVYDLSSLIEAVTIERWTTRGSPRDAWLYARHVGAKQSVAEALSADTLAGYVAALRVDGVSGRTINRRLSACSALLKAARARELVGGSYDVPWQHENTPGRVRFFSDEELAAINAWCIRNNYDDYADLFTFLALTGCRSSEAVRLTWGDIHKGRVSFLKTKNGTDRTIPLAPAARAAVASLHGRYGNLYPGPFGWLEAHRLRVVWSKLRAAFKWMGRDTVVYTFRHTCASNLTMANHPTGLIMKWMGHKTVAMTMRYSHLRPDGLDSLLSTFSPNVTKPVTNGDMAVTAV